MSFKGVYSPRHRPPETVLELITPQMKRVARKGLSPKCHLRSYPRAAAHCTQFTEPPKLMLGLGG